MDKYNVASKTKDARLRKANLKIKQIALREKLDGLRQKSVKWNVEQFHRAIGPIVYIWWKSGESRPLYIGMSKHGLNRALDIDHHCAAARKTATNLEFICCESVADASSFEIELIRVLNPIFNKQHYRCAEYGKERRSFRSLTRILARIKRSNTARTTP